MKFQLTSESLITLAILYGSVTATPTPVTADNPVPSTDVGNPPNDYSDLAALWSQLVPPANLGPGIASVAGDCTVSDNGELVCPQRRDIEEENQSITDAIFNTAGRVIGGLWHGIVPNSGYYGSLGGAGACAPIYGGGFYCPQRRDVQEEDQSIADSVFGTAGNLIGGLWGGIVPNSALQGSARGAGACIVRNGQVFCPSS